MQKIIKKNFGEWDVRLAEPFIEEQEGFRADAYQPVRGDKWTIGFGTTAGVKKGDKVTKREAELLLRTDLVDRQERLLKYINAPVGENQFTAIMSLAYNVGTQSVIKSQLMRKLNQYNYIGASQEFLNGWDTCNGKKVKGLVNRRHAEHDLFVLDFTNEEVLAWCEVDNG